MSYMVVAMYCNYPKRQTMLLQIGASWLQPFAICDADVVTGKDLSRHCVLLGSGVSFRMSNALLTQLYVRSGLCHSITEYN